jgi:hypothetical protein
MVFHGDFCSTDEPGLELATLSSIMRANTDRRTHPELSMERLNGGWIRNRITESAGGVEQELRRRQSDNQQQDAAAPRP